MADQIPTLRQVVRDELAMQRRLGHDRRCASMRLPVLARSGKLAAIPARAKPRRTVEKAKDNA